MRGLNRGFTIIEMLMSLVLFGMIGATVVNFFGRHMKFRGDAEIQAEMHQGLNAAFDALTRDIRLAGACLPRQPVFVPMDGQNNTSPTPDTITLRTGVVSGNTTCVQATLQTATAIGATTLSVDNLTGFTVGKYAFINGTSNGEYFQVQSLSGSSGAGTVTSATGLVNAYPVASGVYAIQERTYSIDTANFPTTTNPVPTLVVQIDRATSEWPAVEGARRRQRRQVGHPVPRESGLHAGSLHGGRPTGGQRHVEPGGRSPHHHEGALERQSVDQSALPRERRPRLYSAAKLPGVSSELRSHDAPFKISPQRGFSLISILMLVGLLLSVSAALAVRVRLDTSNQAAFHTTPQNLALAEAGVNQAIAQFRDIFIDGNIPTGSSASHTGNYALQSVSLGGQPINYQLDQPLTNPTNKQLPLGVPFGGLNVLQYNYCGHVGHARPDKPGGPAPLAVPGEQHPDVPVSRLLQQPARDHSRGGHDAPRPYPHQRRPLPERLRQHGHHRRPAAVHDYGAGFRGR